MTHPCSSVGAPFKRGEKGKKKTFKKFRYHHITVYTNKMAAIHHLAFFLAILAQLYAIPLWLNQFSAVSDEENSCGPNSHSVCVGSYSSFVYCTLADEFHEGPVNVTAAVMLRSVGLPSDEEKKHCGFCICNDGFVRESAESTSRCITREECDRKRVSIGGK